ncbi:MAG: AAA family ATPase [Actinomycetota bacterium]
MTTPAGTGPGLEPVSYDHAAERGVLGALMLNGPDTIAALDGFDPGDCSPDNAAIISTALAIAADGGRPDAVLLLNALDPRLVDRIGAQNVRALLAEALTDAPVATSVAKYAGVIGDLATRRRIQATALDLARNPDNGHVTELVDRLNVLRDGARTRRLTLTPAETVPVARPHWVWDQRIPIGGVTLLAGREGHGKTLLVCWLAARLTRGQLPGERRNKPSDVVYIGLEDDRSTIITPRLLAAGADLSRFHFVDLHHETFTLDTHLRDLENALQGLDVGLIVIDPLDAHLGDTDSHKKAEVQAAVGQLSELTQTLRCGALGLAHFNKNTGIRDILARINGSRAFSSAVRSVLGVGPHPHDDNDRLCVLAKANNTSITDVGAIRYRIEGTEIDNPNDPTDPIATAAVVIVGEEDGHHPDNLLDQSAPEDRTQLEEAIDWLRSLLAHKPQPRADIKRLAKEEGVTDKTLRTARERLGVLIERDDTLSGRPSIWRLPSTPTDGIQQSFDNGPAEPP